MVNHKSDDKNKKIVCNNRQARFKYFLLEFVEAGMVLKGTEVKSLRQGKAALNDSFARIENNEIYLYNCHISPYEFGNRYNLDPKRTRKLLLHREEINRLKGKTDRSGLTLIPVSIYFRDNIAKAELALAKGKKTFDKREDIKKREADREIERSSKGKYR